VEDPLKILDDARRTLEIVGKRFSDGGYFIPDLILGRDKHARRYVEDYRLRQRLQERKE